MKLPGTRSKSRKKELFLRLETVWTRPENQQCVDCGQQNTSYASILGPVLGASKKQKLGVFCCHKCCNYHMTLGRGVCLVKNLKTADDMKDWTEDEIRVLEASGNEVTNGIYEKNLTSKRPPPSDYDAMQLFVQHKYHPDKLRYICQETYEAHHGFWSAKYKETVNQMTEMYNEMATEMVSTTTTSKNNSSGGTSSSSSSNKAASPAQTYGPKLQPESASVGAGAVKNSSPLTGGSTAPTECESSLSETGIPAWEPSWEPEVEKNVTDISSNNHSEDDDNNKDQETDMEEDPSSREKPDEMSISSQVTARLAGRRASGAISGRRISDQSSRRGSDQSRRERRTSTLNPSDHFNQSMSSFRMDPYNQSTTTSHSRSPAPGGRSSSKRASRRLSNESDHQSGGGGGGGSPKDTMLPPPEIGQSGHGKSPGASRRTSLMNRQNMSTRRISSESDNRRASLKSRSASMRLVQANNEAAGGGDPISSQSSRPGISPRRGMSRRSLSTDGSDLRGSTSMHGGKELRQMRSQRRKTLGKSKSFDMESNDSDDDDEDPEFVDVDGAAAEKPRPSPRRAMSRRSLSTDGSDLKGSTSLHAQKELRRMRSQRRNSLNNCSDPELEDDEAAAAEKPRPSPRRSKNLPLRSQSTDGSMDLRGSSSSLHGSKELRQIRSQRRMTSLSKSLNKSKNFDLDFNNNGESDPELDINGENAGAEKPRPSPRKSKSRRSMSTDGTINGKGSSSSLHGSKELRKSRRKSSLNRSKSFDVDFNGNSDEEDADESAEFLPPQQRPNPRKKSSRRSGSSDDGLEVKEKSRRQRSSLNKSKGSDIEDDGVVEVKEKSRRQRRSSLSKSKSSDTEDDGAEVTKGKSRRHRRSSLRKSKGSDTEGLDDGGDENDDSDCCNHDSCDDEENSGGDHHAQTNTHNETPTGNRKANIRLAVTMLAEMNNKTDGTDLVDSLFKDGEATTTKKKSKVDLRREASVILNKREEVSLLLG